MTSFRAFQSLSGRRALRYRRSIHHAVRLLVEALEDRRLLSGMPAGVSSYGNLPLAFEANQGQSAAQVDFLARGSGYMLSLTPSTAVLNLKNGTSADTLQLQVVGANPQAQVVGRNELITKTNYLIGGDPSQWRTDVPNYGKVEYQNVYAGIDLLYYGNQGQLEYDFVVAPGADPDVIQLSIQGAQEVALDAEGNLVLHTSGGKLVQHAPVIYQEQGGVRLAVAGQFLLKGNHQIGFEVGSYDRSRSLVIDPILSYSTYLGGSNHDQGRAIAVDVDGNAYVTGYTYSTNFPTVIGSLQGTGPQTANIDDLFVAKLNAAGTALVYSTYLGGNDSDEGWGIAVDSAGQAHVTGVTCSDNFPTTLSAVQVSKPPYWCSAFVTKLNSSGSSLLYSSYLGSTGSANGALVDWGQDIALDDAGNAYVTGHSNSTDFITTPGAYQESDPTPDGYGLEHAFVAKLDPSQSGAASLVYSTYLGGNVGDGADFGYGIAVDGAGNAYVVGTTESTNFPVTAGVVQPTSGGGTGDTFVTKLNADGSALVYSTYLGGSNSDVGRAIALDSIGNAYLTGRTSSTNFPVTATALQSTKPTPAPLASTGDAFITKLNANGTALVYSTYIGGNDGDDGMAIDVDVDGFAYVAGYTLSTNFPTTANAPQATSGGDCDAFVIKLNLAGSALAYSTYLGGNVFDSAEGMAVASNGSVYLVGITGSTNFPTTAGSFAGTVNGGDDAFVAKLITTAALSINDVSIVEGNASTVSAQFTVSLLDGSSQTVSVSYSTANGTATVGSDYVSAAGTLTFAPGETSHVVTVTVNGDVLQESNESLFVNLSGPTNAAIVDSQGVATIRDDDTTRFYVVDDAAADRTFEYADPGNSIENYALLSGNTTPRGAASNVAGDKVWVADANKKVYVYNTSGGLLGSWTAGTLQSTAQVEGLATNGTDIWIVDNKVDKVYKYTGAATRLTGSQNPAGSFNLNSSNSNPKGIVTDGTSIWVVNDASADKVFKYSLTGTLLGSWTIDAANSTPTGLTIDPTNVNHIWIVDSGTDKVYQYDAATSRTSGSQSAAATFPLATGNTNPQDIADPRFVDEVQNPAPIAMALARWDNGSPVTATRSAEPLATEDRAASSVQEHNHDLALLVLVEESSVDLITGPSKIRRNRMPDAGLISLRAADECFGENEYH